MKLRAHVIGHVGMVRLPSNCASVDFFTMKMLIRAIGQKMSMDVKSIVSKAGSMCDEPRWHMD